MSATIVPTSSIPALSRTEAMSLAATEYQRFGELLRQLGPDDWARPTDCARWTVKQIASHCVAMSESMASLREYARQMKASKPLRSQEGLSNFDAWTEYQALSHADVDVPELIRRYDDAASRALKVRARWTPIRLVRVPDENFGWVAIAYLRDHILTGDVWMHRVDISRAPGRDLVLTAEHDGRFVAKVARDLAARWKRPFTLFLEGTAGGSYAHGNGGPEVRLDAVEFFRILSGRSEGHGLPKDAVPF